MDIKMSSFREKRASLFFERSKNTEEVSSSLQVFDLGRKISSVHD
jgi:hypothetical protein